MARLADMIFDANVPFGVPGWWAPEGADHLHLRKVREQRHAFRKALQEGISDAVVIVADNVADYYWGTPAGRDFRQGSAFPNIAPPFTNFWIEMQRPKRLDPVWENVGHHSAFFEGAGILFHADEIDADPDRLRECFRDPEWLGALDEHLQEMPEQQRLHPDIMHLKALLLDAKETGDYLIFMEAMKTFPPFIQLLSTHWQIRATMVICYRGKVIGPLHEWILSVDPTGKFSGMLRNRLVNIPGGDEPPPGSQHACLSYFYPALLTISFMHCRNVSQEVVQHDARLQKARGRRGKHPLVEYRTVQIHPLTESPARVTVGSGDRARSGGSDLPAHIVPGHFKRYGQDGRGKLFGRYAGCWWWPDHTRGDAAHGIVAKDYSVEAPAGAGKGQ